MKTTISIIIPTYRPNSNLLRTLNKLSKICINGAYLMEVIIINTISKIKIDDLVRKNQYLFQLKIINIEKNKFNHGDTRNLGIDRSKGEYIIFLSQDAYPVEANFIEYFIEDLNKKNIVAVFGKEIAPNKAPKRYLYNEQALWFKQYERFYDKKKRVLFNNKIRSMSQNPDDLIFWYSLSNVFSCYKRSFLKKHRFETIYHGEDVLMGKFIINNGFEKMFDSRCAVEHFHNDLQNYVKRSINDWYFRIFVLKSGLHTKINEKINLKTEKNQNILNIFDICFYYLLKIFILIAVLLIRLKQIILTRFMKEKKIEYVRKYI